MRHHLLILPLLLMAAALHGQEASSFVSKQKSEMAPPAQAAPVPVFQSDAPTRHTAMPAAHFAPVPGTPDHLMTRTASALPSAEVVYDPATGTPIWISGQLGEQVPVLASEEARQSAAMSVLQSFAALLPVSDIEVNLEYQRSELDALGIAHVEFRQVLEGIPVRNAELQVHLYPDGRYAVNGRTTYVDSYPGSTPTLSSFDAGQLALAAVSHHHEVVQLSPQQEALLNYEGPVTRLVWYAVPGVVRETRLAWEITTRPNFIHRWEYLIDAHTGDILLDYDHTCSIGPKKATGNDLNGQSRTIDVFQGGNGTYYLLDASKSMYQGPTNTLPSTGDGYIITADWQNNTPSNANFAEITSVNNTWSTLNVSAHHNASIAYDYFDTVHNHKSIDSDGGDIVSFVNVADDDGQGLDNAFWNGAAMFYGNGRQAFFPLAGALDVAGHEMAHGVIQATANLEYQGESGALNESFADIFGSMIDRDDWTLGEEVVKPQFFPSGALRNMADPHNGGNSLNDNGYQPRHMNEKYTGSEDNGGVHINSGIPNFAFYKFATATSKTKAEQVYYRALDRYHTRSSQFLDSRLAVVQAATDLYGANSAEANAAKAAFDQVGILNGQGGNYDPVIPKNPGQEFIVSTDINPGDPNTLYLSSTTGTNYQPLSTTTQNKRPSTTDDGEVAYFVDPFNNMRGIYLNPANPDEQTLTSNAYWDNVAVSKDGNRIAAVSRYVDTAIWVYDFNVQQWAKYPLYNPTYTQGINTGDVLYADAIAWDHTGQYVMYDAFNRISSTTTTPIEYWDIGVIRVWDNGTNYFGDGFVTKIFSNLEQGESVGNAVFSTNSPNVIAFDYLNDNNGTIAVLGANIELGQVGVIYEQSVLGVPAFSNADDKVLFNGEDTQGNEVIGVIDLAANKIAAATGAQASLLIPDAKWGIWIAKGERDINLSLKPDKAPLHVKVFPNPVRDRLEVDLSGLKAGSGILTLSDLAGRQIEARTWETGNLPGIISLDMAALPAGMYVLSVSTPDGRQVVRIEKQ